MSPDKDDQKKDQRDDHHDDANPMPDTHHVNPDSDDESDKKISPIPLLKKGAFNSVFFYDGGSQPDGFNHY